MRFTIFVILSLRLFRKQIFQTGEVFVGDRTFEFCYRRPEQALHSIFSQLNPEDIFHKWEGADPFLQTEAHGQMRYHFMQGEICREKQEKWIQENGADVQCLAFLREFL